MSRFWVARSTPRPRLEMYCSSPRSRTRDSVTAAMKVSALAAWEASNLPESRITPFSSTLMSSIALLQSLDESRRAAAVDVLVADVVDHPLEQVDAQPP